MNARMFMIFGSPRSGTTLLAQTVGAHPDVVVPQETDFIPHAALTLLGVRDPAVGLKLISDFFEHASWTRSSFLEYFSERELGTLFDGADYDASAVIQVFERLAQRANKRLAGDKSPNNLLNIRAIDNAGLLSESIKILHIVRDIRDVMGSLKEHMPDVWSAGFDQIMPRIWTDTNLYLDSRLARQSNYLRISYEEFVTKPEPVAFALCTFLELPFSTLMFDTSRRNPAYASMTHHRNLARQIGDFSVGRYRRDFTGPEISTIERSATEAMARFGYLPVSVDAALLQALYGAPCGARPM